MPERRVASRKNASFATRCANSAGSSFSRSRHRKARLDVARLLVRWNDLDVTNGVSTHGEAQGQLVVGGGLHGRPQRREASPLGKPGPRRRGEALPGRGSRQGPSSPGASGRPMRRRTRRMRRRRRTRRRPSGAGGSRPALAVSVRWRVPPSEVPRAVSLRLAPGPRPLRGVGDSAATRNDEEGKTRYVQKVENLVHTDRPATATET